MAEKEKDETNGKISSDRMILLLVLGFVLFFVILVVLGFLAIT